VHINVHFYVAISSKYDNGNRNIERKIEIYDPSLFPGHEHHCIVLSGTTYRHGVMPILFTTYVPVGIDHQFTYLIRFPVVLISTGFPLYAVINEGRPNSSIFWHLIVTLNLDFQGLFGACMFSGAFAQ
jgi:hypothetical protein